MTDDWVLVDLFLYSFKELRLVLLELTELIRPIAQRRAKQRVFVRVLKVLLSN